LHSAEISVRTEWQLSTYEKCSPCGNVHFIELEVFTSCILSAHKLRMEFAASNRMSGLNHALHFLVLIPHIPLWKQSMKASVYELSDKKAKMIRTIGAFPLKTALAAVVSFSW
jgi:hypothetical protein